MRSSSPAAARGPFWAQMFADALGCPVDVVDGSEHGARGAAMNAGVAVGLYPSYAAAVARCVRPARTYTPDAVNTGAYRALLEFYRATYRAMFPVWAARAGASQEQSS
ncbi:MAG: FGGY-family carbohydrate kinase [Caldilineaceae bacterium]